MSTAIYYFSGTGNSLKVAKDLNEQLEDSKIIQICKNNISIIEDNHIDKVGFVFPVYFWGVPMMVKNFIESFKINKQAYVFAIATYGGMAGSSLSQIKKILNKKDIMLAASFAVHMPGNDQLLYQPISEDKQIKLFKSEKEQIYKIASAIKNSQHIENKINAIINTFGKLVYSTFKPQNNDKNFWTDEKCIGCGMCLKVCPANNIAIYEGKPKWQHQCESCLACMQWCPQKSIQYKKVTIDRGRYHHPDIKITDLIQK